MNDIKGVIVTRYESSIFCGLCDATADLYQGAKRRTQWELKQDAIARGWQFTKASGWVCPAHTQSERPGTTEAMENDTL